MIRRLAWIALAASLAVLEGKFLACRTRWPDPPALVITTFNVTSSTVDTFFTIAGGKSLAI